MIKSKFLALPLIAAFMSACSNEMENISELPITTTAQTRSLGNDTTLLGELVPLNQTEELLQLKNIYKQMHAKMQAPMPPTDEFFSSNIYAIRELPITIRVRTNGDGQTSSNNYLSCGGANQEVTLSGNSANSSFSIKILPPSSGIPYLIYSTKANTPLCVGHYTSNPNNKILMSAQDNSGSLYGASWNLLPSSSYKGYFAIQSEDYLGQSDPNNMWSVFNYVLEAKSNNKLGYGKRVNNKAQQEFFITPINSFTLKDVVYDLDNATVKAGKEVSIVTPKTNAEYFKVEQKIDIKLKTNETYSYNETAGTLKVTINNGNKKFPRPVPIAGKAIIEEDTELDATYSSTTQEVAVEVPYSTKVDMKPRTLLQLTTKFKTFDLSVPYTATATYYYNGEYREYKVKGIWNGHAIANPSYNPPTNEARFTDLETGEPVNYSLYFDKNTNTYIVK